MSAIETVDDRDVLYELHDGLRITKPLQSPFALVMASEVAFCLGNHVRSQKSGLILSHVLIQCGGSNGNARRPDVVFVSRGRIRLPLPRDESPWDVIPDLAVEVVSPTNTADEIEKKVTEYLDAGVRQVWVLYPESRRLYLHRSRREVSVVGADDFIHGGDLFPGMELRLGEIYAAVDSLAD